MIKASTTDRGFSPKPWLYGDRKVLRRKRCINCGSSRVAKILYGLPAFDMVEPELAEGRLVLGGCCVDPAADPERMCRDCGTVWGQWVAPHCSWPRDEE